MVFNHGIKYSTQTLPFDGRREIVKEIQNSKSKMQNYKAKFKISEVGKTAQ
jgi:hypothetical protein